jgi:hypothetical protein
VVDNLSRISISVELKPEEYGKWITTTSLGKFEKMAIAPVTPFTEIDDWLYGIHYPELLTNRSHVADAELNKLPVAPRREIDAERAGMRSSTPSSGTSSTRPTMSICHGSRSTSRISRP